MDSACAAGRTALFELAKAGDLSALPARAWARSAPGGRLVSGSNNNGLKNTVFI